MRLQIKTQVATSRADQADEQTRAFYPEWGLASAEKGGKTEQES
jgi:hypothetical protein